MRSWTDLFREKLFAFAGFLFPCLDQNVPLHTSEGEAEIAALQLAIFKCCELIPVGLLVLFHHLGVKAADHEDVTTAKQNEVKRAKADENGGVV